MRRPLLVALAGALVAVAAAGASQQSTVQRTVGVARLVAPGFGYAVAYRTVERTTPPFARTQIGLFVDDGGRWRNVTPPTLQRDGIDAIDDVTFVDRRHGWVAAYNCARVAVYLYRTSDGGRSWQSLGAPGYHSCGGGPTFLSFADDVHGWMEPVSPNGPQGALLRTTDGGRTWTEVAEGPVGPVSPPGLPCLAPIRFVSALRGWTARCWNGALYASDDAGRTWRRVALPVQGVVRARLDLPWVNGAEGVVAATVGTRPPNETGWTRAVDFAVSRDGGRTWRARASRSVAHCPLTAYFTWAWPAAVASARVWWVVAGGVVQLTTDGGRSWRVVAARGLPTRPCSVASVSAASATAAWAVVDTGGNDSALFETGDGGRSWHPVRLLR